VQKNVNGNTMDSQEAKAGLAPKTKKQKKCAGGPSPAASLKSWLRIPPKTPKTAEYAKGPYLSANGAVLSVNGGGQGSGVRVSKVAAAPFQWTIDNGQLTMDN